MHNKMKIFILK